MKNYYIYILFLLLFFFSCKQDDENPETFVKYYCNVENINDAGNLLENTNNKIEFLNASFRSNDYARSGKYSIKSDSINKYVFTLKLPKYKPEQHYKVTVWRYGSNENGMLVVQGDTNLYIKSSKSIEKDSLGWEKLKLSFFIPKSYKNQEIKIYVWNNSKQIIYFDDIEIEQISKHEIADFKQVPLRIFIEPSEMLKLNNIRNEAFKKGILETTDDSWVKAIVFYGDTSYKAKMRLKGDWLDHLQGVKWSFRIELKKGGAWKGMRTFSIQTPYARHFLDEWFIHKIFEKEDVLTTRYGFVPVTLNGNSLGIYSYEEHFEKQLVESKKRREGSILKMSEESFWALIKLQKEEKKMPDYPLYETSKVLPYKKGKLLKSENLYKHFIIAQSLIYQYKNQTTKISEIFDVEKLAKYHALVSLTKAYHSMRWHNQRYYYDPVLQKCEIIAFDCFVEHGSMDWVKRPIFGNFSKNEISKIKPESKINYYVFEDSLFVENYIKYLKIYSDTTFINSIFAELDSSIIFYEQEIRKEFSNYSFNKNYYTTNAKSIRADLPKYEEKTKTEFYKNLNIKDQNHKQYNDKYYPNLAPEYVQAYLEENNDTGSKIRIINFNPLKIIILGHKITKNSENFNRNIIIGKYGDNNNEKIVEFPSSKVEIVYFKVNGYSKIYQVEVLPWAKPLEITPRQELISNNKFLNESSLYTISSNKIIFNKGKHTLNKPLVIPQNYNVFINEGTEIDFVNKAVFISYSPVYIKGSTNNKVKFTSTDKSSQGFLVIQAKEKSHIDYATFDGFNTFNYKGWGVSGAINFYESDVEISNTIFSNNSCEDMLNIIRSDFKVVNCKFENTFSDAFDSDFCTGELAYTEFVKLGNDAIDFSGSQININNCIITNAQDKGISGGEGSTLQVSDCTINGTKIAIAAKDNSKLIVENCKIENSIYGLAAFQKKPEYGAGFIKCNNLTANNINTLILLEENSTLILNGDTIKGKEKEVAKRFY